MRVKPEQLQGTLKSVSPVYLISGDEPLQLAESADAIRFAARQAGYAVREVISIDQGNEWQQLAQEADSFSIFAEKKLIDLRFPSGKPGIEGSKALIGYCQNIPQDTVLLLTAGKLDSAAQKSLWFQTIDKIGVVVQVWPLQGNDLLLWLQRRAGLKGMQLEQEAAKSLAARIEGNLLAAAQEIEKLFILYGAVSVDRPMIEKAVVDSTRFDVYKLSEALLQGKLNRALKILSSLQAEGVAAPVVLWALSREVRLLLNMHFELKQGAQKDLLFKKFQVWDKQKPVLAEALHRLNLRQAQHLLLACAKADRQIKGQLAGDGWDGIFEICVGFCPLRSN